MVLLQELYLQYVWLGGLVDYMTKKIQRFEKPSLARQLAHTKAKKELVDYIVETEGITKDEAELLIDTDSTLKELLVYKDTKTRLKMANEMIPIAMEAFKKKADSGSMEQARAAVTALAILRDKAMGTDKYSAPIQIGGQNVQVNLSWKPKWMKK